MTEIKKQVGEFIKNKRKKAKITHIRNAKGDIFTDMKYLKWIIRVYYNSIMSIIWDEMRTFLENSNQTHKFDSRKNCKSQFF